MTISRRDYFRDRFSREELDALLRRTALKPRDVLSTRSGAYRALALGSRKVDDDELLDMMVSEPTLLRRPLIVSEHGVVVGFNRDAITALARKEKSEEA